MPTRHDIVTFHDPPVPDGESPWVGDGPSKHVDVVPWDHAWTLWFDTLAGRIRRALGWKALTIEHVGSTAVPGLPAKPVIDIDLTVADPNNEAAYLPALLDAGFELRVREPWWFGHRCLRHHTPLCNLHVFGPDSPEPFKHRIFREWLRAHPEEREAYARAKQSASHATNAESGNMMDYNAHKERVLREIYQRAFLATGLLDDAGPSRHT